MAYYVFYQIAEKAVLFYHIEKKMYFCSRKTSIIMKRILSVLAVLTMASFAGQSVKAQDTVFGYTHQGTTLYYLIDNAGDATLVPPLYPDIDTVNDEMWTGYTKPQGAVVIPDSVPYGGSNHAVTRVGYCAFFRCYNVTHVTMPSTLRAIDRHGFLYCSSLTSPVVPEGVTTIGFGAFDKCISMQTITLPSTLTTIGDYAFYKCSSLQSLTFPVGLTSIGLLSFAQSGLTNINLPEGLTALSEFAFADCGALQSVSFPSSLSAIGGACFQGDTSLASVIIPVGVDTIHQWAFYGCKSLPTATLPEGLVFIGQSAFNRCESLQSIVFPSTLDSIGKFAFYGCITFDSVALPDGMRHISEATFAYCENLKWCHLPSQMEFVDPFLFYGTGIETIEVPEGVTYIDSAAFGPCPALHKVTLPSTLTTLKAFAFQFDSIIDTIILNSIVPPTVEDSAFFVYSAKLVVPCGTVQAYRQHEVWGQFPNIVEDCNAGIEDIESNDINVYVRDGRIIVEGAEVETVSVYDMMGRQLSTFTSHLSPLTFPTGVYMVKVGTFPARKVVVIG